MPDRFSRTRTLLGEEGLKKLKSARALIFGVGGVGSFAAEALARAGVGGIDIVDNDVVSVTNINRQIIALDSTLGEKKVSVMSGRMRDINPDITVNTFDIFVSRETIDAFDFAAYSYVIDAVDTISAKLLIIERCRAAGTPVISSMGAGNKLDPKRLTVTDIYETRFCPLARVMRRELRARGISSLKVVYSDEEPAAALAVPDEISPRRSVPGSISFVPPVAGMLIAGEVVRDLLHII